MKRITITCLLAALLAFPAGAQRLVILHTNDSHSQIEPIRTGSRAGLGGVDRRLQFIDSVKAVYGVKKVLVLDGGDYNQGTPYFTVGGGDLELSLMNVMGYDVVSVGNHEFDNGIDEFARRLSSSKFKTITCSYDFKGTPLEKYVRPFAIVHRGGMKIGIVGVTVNLKGKVADSALKEMEYKDFIPEVNKYAEYLRNRRHCDLVICLSHLGYDDDLELAAASKDLDLIIGGHSHTYIKEASEVKNLNGRTVPVVQAGNKGTCMGELKIY